VSAPATTDGRVGAGVALEVQREVEQFLFWEARLLDERRFEDWFEVLADDLHYWMPIRSNRMIGDLDREVTGHDELAYFDEDKDSMWRRLTRLQTGMAWAEDPPSRTRHLVTNVTVTELDDGLYQAESCFIVYRTRLERDQDLFVGGRTDQVRRTQSEAGFELVARTILLDQAVLMAKNLSIFF
jgi:3-phenylpropionate/cinnamic acid dioxygenase small subunit